VLWNIECVSVLQSQNFPGWTRYTTVESDAIYIRLVEIFIDAVICNL
jgi:hypothetical protein